MIDQRRIALPRHFVGAAWAGLLTLLMLVLVAGFFVEHDTPWGVVNRVPLPHWLRPYTQVDALNYRIHATLGIVFEDLGAPAGATASEWFKGAYHARTPAQMATAANGLIAVQQRSSTDQVEAMLCPALRSERREGVPARVDRQVQVLAMAGLSCAEASATASLS